MNHLLRLQRPRPTRRRQRVAAFTGLAAIVVPALIWFASPVAAAPRAAVSVKPDVGNVIEVRPNRVNLMVDGFVERSVWYAGGPLTVESLVVLVNRPSWLSRTGDTVELHVGLFQAPQSDLVFAAPAVKRVFLDSDPSGIGGTIRGTSAAVRFQGVSVTGWDSVIGEPAQESPLRPYIYYVHGSSVRIVSVSFDHLGRLAAGGEGVTLGSATTGSLTGAKFGQSRTGLSLIGTGAVTVTGSSVQDSSGDGVVLKAATPVLLQNVRLTGNAGYGVQVRESRATRLIGITTAGNANGGIRLAGTSQTTVSGISSSAERLGLLVDDGSSRITVVGAKAVGDDTAVLVSNRARQVSLDHVTAQDFRVTGLDLAGIGVRVSGADITSGPTGVSLTRASTGVQVTRSVITDVGTGIEARPAALHILLTSVTVNQVRGDGVLAAAAGITMRGLRITSAGAGVRIYGASDGVTLTGSTISTSSVGVAVSNSVRGISVSDVTISGATTGVSSSASKLQISGGSITNTSIAMRLSGNANIAGTAMSKVSEGLRVSSGAAVNVSGIHLSATGIGFRVATGGQLRVGRSVIGAGALAVGHVSYGSHNSLPAEKLRWYGLAAAVAAASACMLELLRRLREKAEDRTWLFPAGVFNTR